MENLIVSLNCVLPMFLVLCTGFLVRSAKVVPDEMFHHLSTLSFRALLPCLLFNNIYTADLEKAVQPRTLIFLTAWLLAWFSLCYAVLTSQVKDPRRRGAYIQNSFRSNIAVIGVSLGQVMMGAEGLALLSMAITIIVPIYNVLAVFTLETCRGGSADLRKTARGIVRNPLIIACALGIICVLLGVKLPFPVERAVANLGNAGSVTTLVALGGSFRLSGAKKNLRPLTFACLTRLVLAPLAAVVPAALLGMQGDALGTVLIIAASPMASTSYPMALACGSDHELTGQLVVLTSLICSFTLFLWIFSLKQLGLL